MKGPRRVLLIAVACSAVFAGGCASEGMQAAKTSATKVEVVNIAYSPATLEIESGTDVVWINQDDGVRHTVTSGLPGDNGVPGVSKP